MAKHAAKWLPISEACTAIMVSVYDDFAAQLSTLSAYHHQDCYQLLGCREVKGDHHDVHIAILVFNNCMFQGTFLPQCLAIRTN